MYVIKIIALIVLGAIAFLTLVIGLAAPFYEDRFNERRERFLREGKPLVQTVVAKRIGRKGKFLIVGPEGTKPHVEDGVQPEGEWIRASPATYDQYRPGDRIEVLVIGDEYFVRDSKFYAALTPTEATVMFGIAGVLFVLVRRWRPRTFSSDAAV